MTGVMKLTAMRTASKAMLKQSAGEHGGEDGTGHSPLRPNIACSRSACSVLVGRPVLGPPRCTSTMMQRQFGHHGQADRLGLEADARAAGAVTPMAPPKEAPMAMPMAAISSSACRVLTPKRFRSARWCRMSLAGVIG